MTALATLPSRYHALDSLRAAMMFLGIYLHAAVAYSPSGTWPYRQTQLTTALDWTIIVIHVFRMPIFYAMAGFFAALLLARYGYRAAAANRFKRIVVPLVVGWLIVFPVATLLARTGRVGFASAWDSLASGREFAYAHPMHLWFLEYLIVLYLLAATAVVVVPRVLSQRSRTRALRWFGIVVRSPWAPLALSVPSFLAMLAMRHPWIEDPPSFVPVVRIVAVYAVPFAFGWLLFLDAELLQVLSRRAWRYAFCAVIAAIAYRLSLGWHLDRDVAFYVIRALHAVAMWLLILGVTGLFLRYLSGYSALRRYLCDSSYFLYIAHLPVIIGWQLALKDVAIPPLAKVFVVLAGTIVVLLPLYRWGVRPTFIGATLNGRRYPAALPVPPPPLADRQQTPEKLIANPQ